MEDRTFQNTVSINNSKRNSVLRIGFAAIFVCFMMMPTAVFAQQGQWIWSPRKQSENAPTTVCYFRKKFTLIRPEKAELFIAAGDRYQLFVNGLLASEGESYGSATKLDVSSMLQPGVNLIAAKVEHTEGTKIGLATRLRVKEKGETRWRSLVSDSTWKTRLNEVDGWKSTALNDLGWLSANGTEVAAVLYQQQQVKPAKAQERQVAQAKTPTARTQANTELDDRFEISSEFKVQQVVLDRETGSLIAMAFNEFGKLILSKENGPLIQADITKQLTDPQRFRVLCNEVTTCQGILPLNGDIFVTGQGPDGLGLYRLTDADRDGNFNAGPAILRFTGKLGEHGPHGITLGRDGMIYIILGNGSQLQQQVSATSPYLNTYEGDMVARYEDPGGHAAGVKAPGGTIIRMSVDGSKVETVAGGIRNAYDLAFNSLGDLFIHDSDMESDMGMSWYRPTHVFHVAEGAEMGWRSGWSKFPEHFADQTPPIGSTGRGSPTGAVLYDHLQFPARFHDSIFLADWSEGRILNLTMKPSGAGYAAKTEEFLRGKPMNVCDLDIGEDGSLYFCTGGRGTAGGVYRVVWNGKVPDKMMNFKDDLTRVIRHPQPDSAWARQNIAKLRQKIGDKWGESMIGVAKQKENAAKIRMRALDCMVLYGPFPNQKLLNELSQDQNSEIRAHAARLCGLRSGNVALLEKLITDSNPRVRRIACESFLRLGEVAPLESLTAMIGSADRLESLSARRLLERVPSEKWAHQILTTENKKTFVNGALALCTGHASLENSYKILARTSEIMDGFVSDEDFISLLRVVQLALKQGDVKPDMIPAFVSRIKNEFPSGNGTINTELSRVMAYLKIGDVDGRIVEYLNSDSDDDIEKLHVAMYLQTVGNQLAGDARLALIDYLESAQSKVGGGSYKFYLSRAIREVSDTITPDQVGKVLSGAEKWPNAVLSAFYKLPTKLDAETVDLIKQLDGRLASKEDDESQQIRLGVIAVLAQSADVDSMDYLRELWRNEPDRRADISIGLAQDPANENWAYLVSSMPVLDDLTATEVLTKLSSVNRRPRQSEHYRQAIMLGYRLRSEGAADASKLLSHWSGENVTSASGDWVMLMNQWKSWFERKWPEEAEIKVVQEEKKGQYSVDQILSYLETKGLGNAENGHAIYTKAQCASCHRFGAAGIAMAPDLTSIAARFSNREIAEAVVHPSKIVSDQYKSKTILTEDGTSHSGLALLESDGSYLVVRADGTRVRVGKDNIDEVKENDISSMPAQLFDNLSLSEIADLFAYLNRANSRTAQQDSQTPPAVK